MKEFHKAARELDDAAVQWVAHGTSETWERLKIAAEEFAIAKSGVAVTSLLSHPTFRAKGQRIVDDYLEWKRDPACPGVVASGIASRAVVWISELLESALRPTVAASVEPASPELEELREETTDARAKLHLVSEEMPYFRSLEARIRRLEDIVAGVCRRQGEVT